MFFFLWKALQMTKTWSCDHLQRLCRHVKAYVGSTVACQSNTAKLELWTWSCGFRSAGLAIDRQQNHCVHRNPGEKQRNEIVDTSKAWVPNLFLTVTMYHSSISTDEHVPLKFLVTKRLSKIEKSKEFFSCCLKVICINIWTKIISKYIFLSCS